jgi:hypothetical protein
MATAPLLNTERVRLTRRAAPKLEGAWIEVDLNIDGTVIIDCESPIHLGEEKNRQVTFRANADCILKFTNDQVFGTDSYYLRKDVPKTFHVNDMLGKNGEVETRFDVDPVPKLGSRGEPRIVVP